MVTANNPVVDWKLLNETLEHYFYLNQGFEYVEVPWLVSLEAIRSTYHGPQAPAQNGLYLVGSAEQSFVELLLQGKLDPKQSHMTLSPCFRDETQHTDFTRPHFMKVELMRPYAGDDDHEVFDLARIAHRWFKQCASERTWTSNKTPQVEIVKTDEGLDVEINGVEVGSYGVRHYKEFSWVYGTAMAEPRFSALISKIARGEIE